MFIRLTFACATITFCSAAVLGQNAQKFQTGSQISAESTEQWWLSMGLIFVLGIGLAAYFWWKSKRGAAKPEIENRYQNYYSDTAAHESEGLDAERELEWLRKLKKQPAGKPNAKLGFGLKKPQSAEEAARRKQAEKEAAFDTRTFQVKMRKMQYSQLPINSFTQLAPAKSYRPLAESDDSELLNAIEQVNDEFEEDETVREIALRVLAAFKSQNSIEAVAQIALYDLSSNLRSKAVATLADYDHEGVFEAVLMACADPTREVRAAAARSLFRLSFDRAHAWKRIIESNDDYRIIHASRAAIEAGIVVKSFDRLIHDDVKVAYEAFALCSILIRAGETKELFSAIQNHTDLRVKFALLHVLKTQKDERLLPELYKLATLKSLSPEVLERVRETIAAHEEVAAWSR